MGVFSNILSWFVRKFFPSLLPHLLPKIEEEDISSPAFNQNQQTKCIAIGRPGGKEQLRLITLKPGFVTAGYNVGKSFVNVSNGLPPNTAVVRVSAFSVNFADCMLSFLHVIPLVL